MSTDQYNLISRREVLRQANIGFGSLALAALLGEEAAAAKAHHTPRAKRMIFLFMKGGPSQVDTFDPKPRLTRDHGKKLPIDRPRLLFHSVGEQNTTLMPSPWKFHQHGDSGIPVSELFPHIATCVDELCVIRSLHGTNPAHGGATLKMHTGSDTFIRPSMGSWISYGLGNENRDLPTFITIAPTAFHGGVNNYGSAFLPAIYQGTPIGQAGLPATQARIQHITPTANTHQQRMQLDLVRRLNRYHQQRDPNDTNLEARIRSFELAFRMQSAMPWLQDVVSETRQTQQDYGLDNPTTKDFGYQCLLARRLIEQGVRLVQVTHQNGSGHWDQHADLFERHPQNAREVDKPIAALLKDLKQRGLLDDTLVLWGGEFGRTPTVEDKGSPKKNGRDHNPDGFTMWMAGGGVKAGSIYGATDEFGYFANENKMHIHDLHATILHILGLDHERLTYRFAGRDFRLTDVHGEVATGVLG
jgi:uncharacterized protein (DUF1501 family)